MRKKVAELNLKHLWQYVQDAKTICQEDQVALLL